MSGSDTLVSLSDSGNNSLRHQGHHRYQHTSEHDESEIALYREPLRKPEENKSSDHRRREALPPGNRHPNDRKNIAVDAEDVRCDEITP
jgi:hypothetical protein